MTAAAPYYPPSRPTSIGSNRYAAPFGDSDEGPSRPVGPQRAMRHISDLAKLAQGRVEENGGRYAPIGRLLSTAETAMKQANAFLEYRRPDLAYIEYLIASEIVVNIIPQHPDSAGLRSDRGNLYRVNRELIMEIHSQEERFSKIRDIIVNDNKRNETQPTLSHTQSQRSTTPAAGVDEYTPPAQNSRYSMPPEPTSSRRDDELMLPRASLDISSHMTSSRPPSSSSSSPRYRPPVHPKPSNLHGRVISPGAGGGGASLNGNDGLMERFARLRTTGGGQPGANSPVNDINIPHRASGEFAVKMPSPTDYLANANTSPLRPLGPRPMPPPPTVPARPPKLPLDTQFVATMPKEPSPTYSPARNLSTPVGINPPRSTARSMVGSRSNSIVAANVSGLTPNSAGDDDSYSPNSSVELNGTRSRQKSVHLPRETQISAAKLYDYIKMYNVLIIDVRSREEFDQGHIWVRSVLCVEPTALRNNMSAEELADSLVLSPDEEQAMFENRNQYDIVVYHDRSTKSTNFLNSRDRVGNEVPLKQLHDALYEFNHEKPLQRPPILLMGGLEAWIDLLGEQALKISNTAAIVSQQGKPSRPIRRVPMASDSSKLNLQKRRLRDYNPLDAEEERKWLEKARSERRVSESRPVIEEEEDEGANSQIFRSTEDFLRRYPDASHISQQSMMFPPQRQEPIPTYAPPDIPTVPSRPPPSVARMSYSGVHERTSAPLPSQSRASQLPVYVPPSHHPQYRLPRTGLVNFGVTCYMNSTVQCLNATLPLTRIFLNNSYLNLVQRENWKGSKGLMAENYATLVQNMWQGDVRALRPSSLRKLCARFNSEWGVDNQQDAKEFLEFLLDILHEDLNSQWSRPPLRELTPAEEASRERLPKTYAAKIEWGRYVHREKSIISDLFAGQHASRLRCTTCHFTSTTYEAFFSISVEIPRDRPADIRDCLRSYCSEERLSGDEVWKCPRCKQEREATKQITITRAPLFLVLHLKRFSASHVERARKVRTPIEFPLNGLDLGPFMLPPITPEEENIVAKMPGHGPERLAQLRMDPAMNGPYIYNAYGVMRHIGNTLSSGHYISMIKDTARGCWRQFNDERVNDFDPNTLRGGERLQNDQAYIVFYERERTPIRA